MRKGKTNHNEIQQKDLPRMIEIPEMNEAHEQQWS